MGPNQIDVGDGNAVFRTKVLDRFPKHDPEIDI